ncbi:SpoIIE family protein phosphatase, partial [candidate division KSB1 bacterium]|nr:SpoIIE family protein phosphatase [candidate division KSB1 bacterium]
LFQSTFPQLIQLIILILIFYAFLSGWQAENLRSGLKDQLSTIRKGRATENITLYEYQARGKQLDSIQLPDDDRPIEVSHLPKQGVVQIDPADGGKPEYFLYSKSTNLDTNFIHLIKLDSKFLGLLKDEFQYLAGSLMMAYPYVPDRLPAYFYRINFWQNDRYMKIFPFGIRPNDATAAMSASLLEDSDQDSGDRRTSFLGLSERYLTFGRLFFDLWEQRGSTSVRSKDTYLCLDIVFTIRPDIFWSGLPQVIFILIIVYFLINLFVIRRVVRFGAEINRMIVQKFQQLKGGITQISSGNLSYKIQMEGDDEFVELADQFNNMGNQLQQSIAEAREKERLEYEMQSARQVQLSLLPRELPVIPDYEVAASLKTATEVGGDFYDLFQLDEHRFLFTIGDVSGKGSSAAYYMAQFMSLVRYSQQFTFEPDEICSRLNYYFSNSITDSQIFVTAIIGILNAENNSLNFVRAGHTEPVFVPADITKKIFIPPTKGIGIGLTKNTATFSKSLKKNELFMDRGDTIIFYTDGVIEASRHSHEGTMESGEPSEMYGEARLKELITRVRRQNPKRMISELDADIESFYAGHPRVDDHTIMMIQRINNSEQV